MSADGNYTCTCDAGFTGNGSQTCSDVDECKAQPPVCGEFPCQNTAPDYICPTSLPYDDLSMSRVDTSMQGVVVDNNTLLMWQRDLGSCASGKFCTWGAANDYCHSLMLAGSQDWRMPTVVELLSIMDMKRFNPAIDEALFGPLDNSLRRGFWTSVQNAMSKNAWYVNQYDGEVNTTPVTVGNPVRCVRFVQ